MQGRFYFTASGSTTGMIIPLSYVSGVFSRSGDENTNRILYGSDGTARGVYTDFKASNAVPVSYENTPVWIAALICITY
jgi:hypothetical protein